MGLAIQPDPVAVAQIAARGVGAGQDGRHVQLAQALEAVERRCPALAWRWASESRCCRSQPPHWPKWGQGASRRSGPGSEDLDHLGLRGSPASSARPGPDQIARGGQGHENGLAVVAGQAGAAGDQLFDGEVQDVGPSDRRVSAVIVVLIGAAKLAEGQRRRQNPGPGGGAGAPNHAPRPREPSRIGTSWCCWPRSASPMCAEAGDPRRGRARCTRLPVPDLAADPAASAPAGASPGRGCRTWTCPIPSSAPVRGPAARAGPRPDPGPGRRDPGPAQSGQTLPVGSLRPRQLRLQRPGPVCLPIRRVSPAPGVQRPGRRRDRGAQADLQAGDLVFFSFRRRGRPRGHLPGATTNSSTPRGATCPSAPTAWTTAGGGDATGRPAPAPNSPWSPTGLMSPLPRRPRRAWRPPDGTDAFSPTVREAKPLDRQERETRGRRRNQAGTRIPDHDPAAPWRARRAAARIRRWRPGNRPLRPPRRRCAPANGGRPHDRRNPREDRPGREEPFLHPGRRGIRRRDPEGAGDHRRSAGPRPPSPGCAAGASACAVASSRSSACAGGWACQASDAGKTCVVVVDIAMPRGPLAVGLLVDEVTEVRPIDDGPIDASPGHGASVDEADLIAGIGHVGDRTVCLIDVERLLTRQEREQAARIGGCGAPH